MEGATPDPPVVGEPWKISTVPVIGLVELTVAVSVNDPPGATFPAELVREMVVGTGPLPPPPPPPPPLLPPPQPNTNVMRKAALANTAALNRFLRPGIPTRKIKTNPLATLADHQVQRYKGARPPLSIRLIAVPLAIPLGPVEVSVTVTGTGAPFKFTVVGLKLIPMPERSTVPGPNVTGLGVFEAGVTVIVAVWD